MAFKIRRHALGSENELEAPRNGSKTVQKQGRRGVIQRAREFGVSTSEESCGALVQSHLREVHQRALRALEDWSGPYAAEEGEYYYNHRLKALLFVDFKLIS